MPRLLFLGIQLVLWNFCSSIYAQVISSDSLLNYADTKEKITVCDLVAGVYVSQKSNTIFLNFGEEYPNQKFVGVIFSASLKRFPYDPAIYLKDSYVCLTGEVKLYRGKPEIIIFRPSQIEKPEQRIQEK